MSSSTDQSTTTSTCDQLHVAMFPWFAIGHASPFVQLANKLSLHGVRVSFFSSPGTIARIRSSRPLNPQIQIIPLPISAVDGLPPGLDNTSDATPAMAELLKQALDLLQPQIKTILSTLRPHFVLFDFVQHWMPKLASQLGIKTIRFSVFSAICEAYLIVPARVDKNKNSNNDVITIDDLKKPPNGFPLTSFTSLKEFQTENLLYAFKSFYGGPSAYNRVVEGLSDCTAIVFKTCNEMERPYVDFIKSQFGKPLLLTGPLAPEPPSAVLEEKWATWLGQFPTKSVVFCSFGSETFLTDDQIHELALGLELTGMPFFLVLNFPSVFDGQTKLAQVLPQGFMDRVKDRGVVHTGWVQQQLILGHESVGCYLCHSGFSSVIEAFVNDCQLVLLPLKGDQFLNSKLIAGDMEAGVEVNRRDENGYFGKGDIVEAVKTIMVDVDEEPCVSLRANHKKWREFLLNEEIQNRFIVNLVEEMKSIINA